MLINDEDVKFLNFAAYAMPSHYLSCSLQIWVVPLSSPQPSHITQLFYTAYSRPISCHVAPLIYWQHMAI